jgi:hypothetical protein
MPRSFRRDARRNIPINYLFSFIASFDVIQGLWMIYLRIQGLSLWEIGIAEGFFHLTSFVMEAPTGMVADLWGHKASRLAGRFSLAMAMIILLHVESLPTALAAFFFIALSYNLESGQWRSAGVRKRRGRRAAATVFPDPLVHERDRLFFAYPRGPGRRVSRGAVGDTLWSS